MNNLLDKKIVALAHTEGIGQVLLINIDHIEKSEGIKCAVYDTEAKRASCIDNINKAITFNAFEQIDNDLLKVSLLDQINKSLTDGEILEINVHLTV